MKSMIAVTALTGIASGAKGSAGKNAITQMRQATTKTSFGVAKVSLRQPPVGARLKGLTQNLYTNQKIVSPRLGMMPISAESLLTAESLLRQFTPV
jgi:hypothetical protein